MKNFNKLCCMKLGKPVVTGLMALFMSACGTQTARMDFVNQNVAEGRIVGKEAVADPDILNQYQHGYLVNDKEIGIFVDLDRPHIPVAGGELYVQIGIAAKPAVIKPATIHAVIYDDNPQQKSHQQFAQALVQTLSAQASAADKSNALTVDTSFNRPDWLQQPGMLTESSNDLEALLQKLAQLDLTQGKHHIILLLGDTERPLYKSSRQDLIDLARLLIAKHCSLSIVSLGKKPDFDLVNSMVYRAGGRLAFNNEYFDVKDWIRSELQYIHANRFDELQLSIAPANSVELLEIISPANVLIRDNRLNIKLPELLSGQEQVYLAKLKVPPMSADIKHGLVNIKLDYFQTERRHYQKLQYYADYSYGLDRNDCLPLLRGKVARSQLILQTHKTIADTANIIRQGRNYQAIALLTEQVEKIRDFADTASDKELQRDAAIMAKYAGNLYSFQDSWFQGYKVWKDTVWDRDRYQGKYQ